MSILDKLENPPESLNGPVRVRYFDPETGEPRDTKPQPLPRRRAESDPEARNAAMRERERAVDEGRELQAAMDRRKKQARYERQKQARGTHTGGHNGGVKRPVLVDGVRYESVKAAAEACGASQCWLMQRLKGGAGTCKGHAVAFADGAR